MTNFITLIAFLLRWSAAKYTAYTTEEAFAVASEIIPEGGKPGNICGPLAIKILQDAMIVSQDINPKSFWFLRPWDDYVVENVIDKAFPPGRFRHIRDSLPINEMSRVEIQMTFMPGDFVFLYSGANGTFSHMFAVTWKDGARTPYTVTNYQDENGWHIEEISLIDLFDLFTDPAHNRTFGNTGYGGVSIWREINSCSTE